MSTKTITFCQHCLFPIATDADVCPHCGSKSPKAAPDWQKIIIRRTIVLFREIFYWLFAFAILWYLAKEIICKIY